MSRLSLATLGMGLANTLLWCYVENHWESTLSAFSRLAGWALLCGQGTREHPWFTTIVLLEAPLILAGGPRHGYPWAWLLYPPMWPYFIQNFGPLAALYFAVVVTGYGIGKGVTLFTRTCQRHLLG